MRKAHLKNTWEPVDLLEIKVDRYIFEVQEKLEDYDISVQLDSGQVESLFNNVIEIETEEVKGEEVKRGRVYVRKGWRGKYYSVKNIHLRLSDLIQFGHSLVQGDTKTRIIACIVLLTKFMERLGANMEEEQTAVCVSIYNVAKHYVLTDDNIIEYITEDLSRNDYLELSEAEIGGILSELIEMGIVSLEGGRYEVVEKLVFR